jgi:mono/diheme cytochrome c family protein
MNMNRSRNPLSVPGVAGMVLVAGLAASATVAAGDKRFAVDHPLYQQECGSCHVAYPPQLLSAASWRAVMAGLGKHFGSDASVDAKSRDDILRFLESRAGRRDTERNGKPLLRITETRGFVHEHSEELPRDIWKHPAVKTPANCQACHSGAEKGDYAERSLRLPKGAMK